MNNNVNTLIDTYLQKQKNKTEKESLTSNIKHHNGNTV